jgi:hypothetical protein
LPQLECSSWISSVVASWVVFRLKHGGLQCWGYPKIRIRSPTQERESTVNSFKHSDDARGDWESPAECLSFQSCESIYTCPRAPFIGRRRDFYIPKIPSSSKNIPSVNTYMNVISISYIHKPTTSSHSKPRLFETTTLTLLLNISWIPLFARSPRAVTSESNFLQIPEFPVSRSSWLRRFEIRDRRVFATPRLRRFKIPDHRMFATSGLRRFETPENRMFATLGLRRFETPGNRQCSAPEKHILWTLLNSTFWGWQIFLNSPTQGNQTLSRITASMPKHP